MAHEDSTVNDALAEIYSEVHVAASGKINQRDFAESHLTKDQVDILGPIELVRAANGFTNGLHKDAQDAMLAQDSIDNSPIRSRNNSRERLLLRRMARYREITDDGLMILCILSFSPTFRKLCVKESDRDWQALRHEILENFESIEYFTKVRGLQWANLLKVDANFHAHIQADRKGWLMERLGNVRLQHPHAMVVPQGRGRLRLPTYEGRVQVNISNTIYRHDLFSDMRFEQPPHWPKELDYPSDPTVRLLGTACINCRSTTLCNCEPSNCGTVKEPLLELYHYTKYGARGTGIRSLQRIKKDTILGEYLGEIVPSPAAYRTRPHGEVSFRYFDEVYAWDLPLTQSAQSSSQTLATITAGTYGNWTRYVNHSCEPSLTTTFEVIGNKLRILYKSLEAIEPFEELTTNYGDYYFNPARPCQCGMDTCGGDFVDVRENLEKTKLAREARREGKTK